MTLMHEIQVTDMDCNGCVNAITRAVGRIDPAAIVSADLATRNVRVTSRLDSAAILETIRNAGFSALPG